MSSAPLTILGQVLAGLTLAVCLGLLVRLTLGRKRRRRLDDRVRHAAFGSRTWVAGMVRSRSARQQAARLAEDAIRRARTGPRPVDREGNVIRPKSFRRPDKLH